MPLTYQVYGCRFKCGTKHRRSWARMWNHEEQCWYNPEVKSCITCKHGELNRGYFDSETGGENSYRVCLVDEELIFDGIKPQINCINWEETSHAD